MMRFSGQGYSAFPHVLVSNIFGDPRLAYAVIAMTPVFLSLSNILPMSPGWQHPKVASILASTNLAKSYDNDW